MDPAILTESISKSFDGRPAVRSLSLSVSRGELFGLVGPDGAGKTTTMRILASVLEPDSGEALVCGRSVKSEPEAVKEHIGYVCQGFALYPDLSVEENIRFYAEIYCVPRSEYGKRLEDLLAFSRLGPFRDRPAGALSGGMKQKLSLACALVHEPDLLLLDEPTNGVDPVSRREFWRILHRLLEQGMTIFISTAYLDEAERCDRVAFLQDGMLRACDTPDALKKLFPGRLIEVPAEAPREAAEALERALDGVSAAVFGDRVHLTVTDPSVDEERLPEVLLDAGIRSGPPRRIEPSMEDVFLSLME